MSVMLVPDRLIFRRVLKKERKRERERAHVCVCENGMGKGTRVHVGVCVLVFVCLCFVLAVRLKPGLTCSCAGPLQAFVVLNHPGLSLKSRAQPCCHRSSPDRRWSCCSLSPLLCLALLCSAPCLDFGGLRGWVVVLVLGFLLAKQQQQARRKQEKEKK